MRRKMLSRGEDEDDDIDDGDIDEDMIEEDIEEEMPSGSEASAGAGPLCTCSVSGALGGMAALFVEDNTNQLSSVE